jgi:tRNA(Ile)-lysidine synthase
MIKKFDFDKIKNTEKLLRLNNLENKSFLLAVSGGVDSVVLLHFLSTNFPKLELAVAHVHHGKTANKKTNDYRAKTQKFVRTIAEKADLEFFTNKPVLIKTKKQSEDDLRVLRDQFLQNTIALEDFDFVAKAQHREDLFETRLIRLIRGAGPEGFLAMTEFDEKTFRPLLSWTKNEVLEYASHYKLKFIEDPSNKNENYLRNWIRQNWLVSLDKYRPGSKSSLMRSLENLSDLLQNDTRFQITYQNAFSEEKILRTHLLVLKKSDQKRVLARYLNHMRVKNYTSSQLDEVLKRLDTPKKELTFEVAKCLWTVDTKHISALQK